MRSPLSKYWILPSRLIVCSLRHMKKILRKILNGKETYKYVKNEIISFFVEHVSVALTCN